MRISLLRQLTKFTITVFIIISLCFLGLTQGANAKVIPPKQINLFSQPEWTETVSLPPLETAETIRERLDIRREEIGRSAIKTVHRFSTFKETEPIFFANHAPGNYTFKFVIHWERDLGAIVRSHTTTIDWEIINNQHYRAIVKADDSTFPAHSLEELDSFFANLLQPSKSYSENISLS